MPFKKGESGNAGGRPKTKDALNALRVELKRDGADMPSLRRIWRRIIAEAEGGSLPHAQEIFNRLDGKPAQAIVGDDDEPVRLVFETIIRDKGDS